MLEREQTVDDIVQANLDTSMRPAGSPSRVSPARAQYCYFMADIDEADLRDKANKGGYAA